MRTLFTMLVMCLRAQAQLETLKTTIVITADPVQPTVDRRNSEVFTRTLFSRDDQIFHVLDAGINAGQHEGGGKSLEIRRFGFNLDHGGVNSGLKVLVDNVQQNQATQGHGQGYLGSLKSLSPELVEGVDIVNGPFNAEYGDFSGLGVVHIRTRESMPDVWTVRLQGGSFGSERGFFSFSPELHNGDALFAYEGSHTDGPFLSPLRYTRHNFRGSATRRLSEHRSVGFKYNAGLNDFFSSGQIPLDEVAAGRLDRFGYIDPSDGGRVRSGTMSGYLSQQDEHGGVLKVDAFATRSLFDLYSDFTFFLKDPVHGDGFQQHDSRLIEGANAQYQLVVHKLAGFQALLTTGGNFNDNQINVGLYSSEGRVPLGIDTRDHAQVTNGGAYAQESVTLLGGRIVAGAGLRVDEFRFEVAGRDSVMATLAQPKVNFSYRPTLSLPLTLYANYGRGVSTADARGVVQQRGQPAVSTTDFYQVGSAQHFGRISTSIDGFWIDRSHEQVYVPDDGTFEFKGPSRAYGLEAKASVELNHHLSFNGGVTKVMNAYYRGYPRVYVDSAPHFTANAGLTLAGWHQWSGSLRMRAINHYRLDGSDASIVAAGHTVFDMGLSRRVGRRIELSLALDNFTDRDYYETQNYFESQLPGEAPVWRIHGTPGYPLTATAGITFRLKGK